MLKEEQKVQEDQYVFPYHYQSLQSELFRRVLHAHYLSELKKIVDIGCKKSGARWFDVGCGDGRLAFELRSANVEYTGSDYSERAIAFARAFNPSVKFFIGDASEKLGDEKFDVISMVQVLEHIDPEAIPKIVNGLRDQIADTGVLIVSVPSVNLKVTPKHFQHFTEDSLAAAIGERFRLVSMMGHIDSDGWKKFVKRHKFCMGLWPFHKKLALARRYIDRTEQMFAEIVGAEPSNAHTLIGVFEPC